MSWLVFSGTLVTGSQYALVVVGMVILFRATRAISFAQGSMMALGAYIYYWLSSSLPLVVSFVVAALLIGALGALVYWLLLSRLNDQASFTTVIATLGLNIIIITAIMLIWGPDVRFLPKNISGDPFRFFGDALVLTRIELTTIVVALVVVGTVAVALQRSIPGLQMRAVADSPQLSLYLGVNVKMVSTIAWAVAAMTAAIAGILVAMSSTLEVYSISSLGLIAFPAMLVGGLDSIKGALVGGYAVAFLQTYVALNYGGEWTQVAAYSVLIVLLLLRPSGIFGSRRLERV